MKRIVVVLVCALIAHSLFAAGGGDGRRGEQGPDDYELVVGLGVVGGLCAAPFYIAIEKGYFEEEGLKWREVKVETGQGIQLLTTGQIDVTHNLLATLIQPIANGLEVKIPLGIHTGCIKVLVPVESTIKNPAGLKGKRIGTSGMAASATVITQRYLAELGIGVSANNLQVEWVIYNSSDLPLALERGQVDAIALSDPQAAIIENSGKARAIINSATDAYLKDEFCCVVTARAETVKKHPEAVAKFVRAVQKASKFVQEHPDETASLIVEKKYVAGDPKVNADILRTYNYRASVSAAEVAIARNTRDLQRIGLVKADVDAAALTKDTFIALPGVPDSLYK